MAKPKIPNMRKAYLEHKKRVEKYAMLIQKVYDNLNLEAAKIAQSTGHDPEKQFMFSDYPLTKNAVDELQLRYINEIGAVVTAGTSAEWKESNLVQDLVANKVMKEYIGTDKAGNTFTQYYQTNPDVLKAFQRRADSGMNLSKRVWNLSEQYKTNLEMGISAALAPGKSAAQLAQEVKQYLNEPDLMFRRFRYKDDKGRWKRKWKMKQVDAEGKVHFIDCDKDGYHNQWTGPGYYKSSYKNAMRLARTEINMAYRHAEQTRWGQMDFVVGYEVKITQNSSRHEPDICDDLVGKYPKDFIFSGFHPHCLCYTIPILKTEDEFWSLEDKPSANEVTDVPQGFKDWVRDNSDRIFRAEKRGTLPYFLRDNKEYSEEILRYERPIKIGEREVKVQDLINECKVIKTERGKVYLHPKHGKNEKVENIDTAKWRAECFGEEVILLPNPDGIKSADSYNITRGVAEEFKINKKAATQSAIDQLLRSAKGQSEYVVLEPLKMDVAALSHAIHSRVNRTDLKELRIRIGDFEALYTREEIIRKEFIIKPEDFRMEFSRSGGESEINPKTNAKLINFFQKPKDSPYIMTQSKLDELKVSYSIPPDTTLEDWKNSPLNGLNPDILRAEITSKAEEIGMTVNRMSYKINSKRGTASFLGNGDGWSVSRMFYKEKDGIVAEHMLFDVDDEFQGKGFSKTVLSSFYKQYKLMGVTEINVHANIDIGGYTWARYGFSARSYDDVVGAINWGLLNNTQIEQIEHLIEDWYRDKNRDMPFPIKKIADLPYGRKALLGRDWEGLIDLTDKSQRKVFEKYLGI